MLSAMNKTSHNDIHDIAVKLVTDKWLADYEKSGTGWLRILSNSMSPLIQTGDQIRVTKTDLSAIAIGDIITFWKGSILVTHRVIGKSRTVQEDFNFIERGERLSQHSLVPGQKVVGKVVQIKKADHVIDLTSPGWQILNRCTGAAFYCTFVLSIVNRKFPYVPRIIKTAVQRIFTLLLRIKEKILHLCIPS